MESIKANGNMKISNYHCYNRSIFCESDDDSRKIFLYKFLLNILQQVICISLI